MRSDPAAANVNSRNILEFTGFLGRSRVFGTDQAGTDTDITGGPSTGTGVGGAVNFWTSNPGASSATVNAGLKRWQITPAGNFAATSGKGQHINSQAAQADSWGVATCNTNTVTVTFTTAYTSTPVIVVSDETTAGGARVSASSNTAFTITCTGASDVVDYFTGGNPN